MDVDKSHPLEILNSPGALFELQHNLIKQFVRKTSLIVKFVNSNVQLLAKTKLVVSVLVLRVKKCCRMFFLLLTKYKKQLVVIGLLMNIHIII